jgi:nucleotide-binding universal stress UspA family protein
LSSGHAEEKEKQPVNILYATDGSEGALAAAHFLARLPLGDNCQIHLLTVIEVDGGEAEANDILARTREALGETRARVQVRVRQGDPTQQILEQIHHGSDGSDGDDGPLPDLVVVGTHGHGAIARLFLGSVAERVARHAPCPVLLARPLIGGELDRIVVGLDGSDSAARALDWVCDRLPLPSGGSAIHLLHVITPPMFLGFTDGALVPAYSEVIAAALQKESEDARKGLSRIVEQRKSDRRAAWRREA